MWPFEIFYMSKGHVREFLKTTQNGGRRKILRGVHQNYLWVRNSRYIILRIVLFSHDPIYPISNCCTQNLDTQLRNKQELVQQTPKDSELSE